MMKMMVNSIYDTNTPSEHKSLQKKLIISRGKVYGVRRTLDYEIITYRLQITAAKGNRFTAKALLQIYEFSKFDKIRVPKDIEVPVEGYFNKEKIRWSEYHTQPNKDVIQVELSTQEMTGSYTTSFEEKSGSVEMFFFDER
jgi:hypothetical protein